MEREAKGVVEDIGGERLSKRNLWCYSTGGIGRDMSYNLWNGYIMSFILFTKGLENSQIWVITIIMVICRIWDGVNDPIMGGIVENTHSKFGKFKPWLIIGAITNSIIVITMFSVQLTGWAFIGFFTVMYLLWDITYTMNDIGYWAMMPSLTSNPADRNSLASLAGLCSGLGSILAHIIVPEFTTSSGTDAAGGGAVSGYAIVSVLIAACFVGCQLMTFFCVKEKSINVKEEKSVSFKKMISIIAKNDQLLWMSLVLLLYNIGNSIITSTLGYNYIYFVYGYEGGYASTFSMIFAVFSAVIMIIYPLISKKYARKTLMRLAFIVAMTGYALMLITCSIWKIPFWLLCIFGGLIGFGQNFLSMVVLINLTNTIEYNQWKTGERDEGILFSIRPFMAKISSALLLLITTGVFSLTGALDIANGISDVEQSFSRGLISGEQKLENITDIIGGIPNSSKLALLIVIALLSMSLLVGAYWILSKKCTINEQLYNEMLNDIDKRKKEAERADEVSQPTESNLGA